MHLIQCKHDDGIASGHAARQISEQGEKIRYDNKETPPRPLPCPPLLNLTSAYIPLHTHHLPRSSAAVIGTMEMNSTSLRFSVLTLIVLARHIRAHKRYFLRGAGRKTERKTNARGHRTVIWLVDASKQCSLCICGGGGGFVRQIKAII